MSHSVSNISSTDTCTEFAAVVRRLQLNRYNFQHRRWWFLENLNNVWSYFSSKLSPFLCRIHTWRSENVCTLFMMVKRYYHHIIAGFILNFPQAVWGRSLLPPLTLRGSIIIISNSRILLFLTCKWQKSVPCVLLTVLCHLASLTRGQRKFSSNRSAFVQHWSPALRSAGTCTFPQLTRGTQLESEDPSSSKDMWNTSSLTRSAHKSPHSSGWWRNSVCSESLDNCKRDSELPAKSTRWISWIRFPLSFETENPQTYSIRSEEEYVKLRVCMYGSSTTRWRLYFKQLRNGSNLLN